MNKIVLVLTGIVLLGIAAFALLWFGVGGELQDLAEGVLVGWREGRSDQVWTEATVTFRNGRGREAFRAYLEHWDARLGPFVRVVERTHVSTSSNEQGTRKSVTLDLEFEKGEAEGRFDFEVVDDKLTLRHLSIRAPRDPVEKSDRSALDAEARALVRHYDTRSFVALHAALSHDLQKAWPPATLEKQLAAMHARLGSIEKAEVRTTKEAAEDRHEMLYALTFERGTGTVTVEWFWSSKRWEVVGFTMSSEG